MIYEYAYVKRFDINTLDKLRYAAGGGYQADWELLLENNVKLIKIRYDVIDTDYIKDKYNLEIYEWFLSQSVEDSAYKLILSNPHTGNII